MPKAFGAKPRHALARVTSPCGRRPHSDQLKAGRIDQRSKLGRNGAYKNKKRVKIIYSNINRLQGCESQHFYLRVSVLETFWKEIRIILRLGSFFKRQFNRVGSLYY